MLDGKLSWDPLQEALRERLTEDVLPAVRSQAKSPPRWKLRLWTLALRVRTQWVDLVFVAATLLPMVGGFVLLIASYPWSSTDGAENYSEIVVTAATATAFGGVLFSLVGAPLQAASQLAAGYTAELLGRRTLWLTGAWLVTLALILFVLASFQPDQETAIASGLLTGSSLALVWLAARRLLASSDPQDAAARIAVFIRKGMKHGRAHINRFTRESLPKELRDQPAGVLLIRTEERPIVNGFLRHFKAGVEGALAHRQPTSAILLWDSAVESFLDYARETEGDIGSSQGIIETLLSIADEMVKESLALPLDDVAVHPVKALERLFVLEVPNDSYSVVRSAALQRLKGWIQQSWKDDNTRVPASAVRAIGQLLRESVRLQAHEDALHALIALHDIGAQAVSDQRTHISQSAMQEIVSALSSFIGADDPKLRAYLLKRWTQEARGLSQLRMAEAHVYFMRSTEVIFPGISLWGRGLQEVIAQLGPYAHISSEVGRPLVEWLTKSLAWFGGRTYSADEYFAVDALAVLYCLALTQAHAVAAGKPARVKEAEQLTDAAMGWILRISDDTEDAPVLNPDVAELVWSILLTTSFIADRPQLLTDSAVLLLEKLDDHLQGSERFDAFSVEFIIGLQVAAHRPGSEILTARDVLTETDPWGGIDRGMRIEGLGRVPSLNRNRVAVADMQVIDLINEWAVARFQGFAD